MTIAALSTVVGALLYLFGPNWRECKQLFLWLYVVGLLWLVHALSARVVHFGV